MKKILVSMLVLALALSMAACGNDDVPESASESQREEVADMEESEEDEPEQQPEAEDTLISGDIVGTWYGLALEIDDEIVTLEEFEEATGLDLTTAFTFNADGTASGLIADIQVEGSYEVDGNEIALTLNGETEILYLEDEFLFMDASGMILILAK